LGTEKEDVLPLLTKARDKSDGKPRNAMPCKKKNRKKKESKEQKTRD
jgi:hypothetical protein